MYSGTMYGHWEAIVTLQALIVLSDEDGNLDITVEALCGQTSIPLDILTKGIDYLLMPDPMSRSSAEEGRRIVPLVKGRGWGWRVVNKRQYRDMSSDPGNAERQRRHREKLKGGRDITLRNGTSCDTVSVSVSESEEVDQEEEKNKPLLQKILDIYPKNPHSYFVPYKTLSILDSFPEKEILNGIKRYAQSVRASGNEGTNFVITLSKFLEQFGWQQQWIIAKQKKEDGFESDEEKARRARARELLEKMERGEDFEQ